MKKRQEYFIRLKIKISRQRQKNPTRINNKATKMEQNLENQKNLLRTSLKKSWQ